MTFPLFKKRAEAKARSKKEARKAARAKARAEAAAALDDSTSSSEDDLESIKADALKRSQDKHQVRSLLQA